MSDVDHYSHYLTIYGIEKSQRDSSRNLLLTGQVGIATAALVFYQPAPGLLLFFGLLSFLFAEEWLSVASEHSQRLAFMLWVIMQYETDGTLVKNTMTSLHSLKKIKNKGVFYEGADLLQDSTYKRLLKKLRIEDWMMFGVVIILWFCMVDLAISGNESNIFGEFLLSIIGKGR